MFTALARAYGEMLSIVTLAPVGGRSERAERGLIATIAREREIRRSVNELAAWSDPMLRDIGVTRGDIERTIRFGRM
jgi:uncharacterized protein YjiS (DUF1127 family)